MRRLAIAAVPVLGLIAAGVAAAFGSGWSIQRTPNPHPAFSVYLNGVSCPSTRICMAAGANETSSRATTLVERWSGGRWSLQHAPNPSRFSSLYNVSCTSPSACTAVGYVFAKSGGDGVLAERWNGKKWVVQHPLNPKPPGLGSALRGVSCTARDWCMAVGGHSFTTRQLLAERWNGSRWSLEPVPLPTHGAFYAVSCTSATACTAVGSTSTIAPLAERWNGSTWSPQHMPTPTGASMSVLQGVSCSSAHNCTAAGNYLKGTSELTLAAHWNGRRWSLQHTPNPPSSTGSQAFLGGLSCTAASACIAVGGYVPGTGPSVTIAERWNGKHWSLEFPPNPHGSTQTQLVAASCPSARACTAVGTRLTTSFLSLAERRAR